MPQLTHPADLSGSTIPSASTATPSGAAPATNPRILVVDDNPAIHADFHKVLEPAHPADVVNALEDEMFGGHSGPRSTIARFEIVDAMQGEEAVECVRQALQERRPYALAFVDMRMPPGQDGLKTIQDIWAIDPAIQVVICSAFSDYSWEEIIGATGENDKLVILRKPFDPVEVLQLAHTLTKKWEMHQTVQRQLDNLESLVAERTRQLAERQALFQLILENATDLIAVVDANGRRLYNSPSYESVLGFRPEELLTIDAFSQIHPDDVGAVKAAAETARQTGRGTMLVYRMQHRDGSWRTLESSAGAVRGPDGQLTFVVIVARDITRRHEMELKEQLGQKLQAIGRLAAGIAHEINTPTQYLADNTRFLEGSFRTMAEIVRHYRATRAQWETQETTAEYAKVLAKVEKQSDVDFALKEIPEAIQQNLDGLARISRIVGALKEFSHPNMPEKANVDLNRTIETAVTVSRHEWKYVADVATEFDASLPPVPCILDEINQVLLNLIVNAAHTIGEALKARNEQRGRITIRTCHDGEAARLDVTDTGMGISAELRPRIFEPFFTTKESGKGTGQGLAIVHAIVVQHHQGAVDFISEVGRGTTFRVWLPLK